MITCYRDLNVWVKGIELVVQCYKLTDNFPKKETYGLSSQLQRSAISIPANIAEGHQRRHTKEFLLHISVAHGSLAELETHLEIALRLNYIKIDQAENLFRTTTDIGKMLGGLKRSLEKSLIS